MDLNTSISGSNPAQVDNKGSSTLQSVPKYMQSLLQGCCYETSLSEDTRALIPLRLHTFLTFLHEIRCVNPICDFFCFYLTIP